MRRNVGRGSAWPWLRLFLSASLATVAAPTLADTVFADGFESIPPTFDPSPTLGSDWHPDADGDGVATTGDDCPHAYDPLQIDSDGDGVGDACDPDLTTPVENGAVLDLHAQHVSPYGAWIGFTSPQTTDYGWTAVIAWSTDPAELETLAGFEQAVARGDSLDVRVDADFGLPPLAPVILTRLAPATDYRFALRERFWDGIDGGRRSNLLHLRTLPAPPASWPTAHPRTLVTSADIATLASRHAANDAATRQWFDILAQEVPLAAADPTGYYGATQYCVPAALLYHASGDAGWLAHANALLQALRVEYEEDLTGNAFRWADAALGLCTDLLWNQLDAATREAIVARLLDLDELEANRIENARLEDTDEYSSIVRTGLVDGALACGEAGLPAPLSQRACALLDRSLRAAHGVQLVKLRRDGGWLGKSGGGMPDGSYYGNGTATYWMQTLTLLANGGLDAASFAPWLRHHLISMHVLLATPGFGGFAAFGDSEDFENGGELHEAGSYPFRSSSADVMPYLIHLFERAGRTEDAAWAREARIAHAEPNRFAARAWDLLFDHADLAPATPPDAPLAFLDSGLGSYLDRSDATATASFLAARAGWCCVDHKHLDAGHAQIYRKGRWITAANLGYDGVAARAAAYNALLLDVDTDNDDGLGQAAPQDGGGKPIRAASTHARHGYLAADLTAAYESSDAAQHHYARVQRSWLWLKPQPGLDRDTLVSFDHVENAAAAPSGLRRRWQMNFWQPTVSLVAQGADIALDNDAGPSQRARLRFFAAAPVAVSVALPEGAPASYPSTLYQHRIVADPGSSPSLRLVAALDVRDAGAAVPGDGAYADSGEGLTGVRLDRGLVLFADAIGATGGAVELAQSGAVTVWIGGLDPARRYRAQVERNGGQLRLSIGAAADGDLVPDGGLIVLRLDAGTGYVPGYAP